MTDREALRSMLIYAQREAEVLKLTSVARLLALAVADVDAAPADPHRIDLSQLATNVPSSDGLIRTDVADAEFHSHFAPRRLQ